MADPKESLIQKKRNFPFSGKATAKVFKHDGERYSLRVER